MPLQLSKLMAGAELSRPLPANSKDLYASFQNAKFPIDPEKMVIVAGSKGLHFVEEMQKLLGPDLPVHQARGKFTDTGETNSYVWDTDKPVKFRKREVFIVQSMYPDPNNTIVETYLLARAAKENGAAKVYAIIPYFAYGREDRRIHDNMSVSVAAIAQLLAFGGIDEIFTLDLHSDQSQVAVPNWEIAYACKVLAPRLKQLGLEDAAVLPPDAGAAKRAARFARRLNGKSHDLGIVYKKRDPNNPSESSPIGFKGNVEGKKVVIYDDVIVSGATNLHAAQLAIEHGAIEVFSAASHALLVKDSRGRTFLDQMSEGKGPIKKIITTNSVDNAGRPELQEAIRSELLETYSVVPMLVNAILTYVTGELFKERLL